MHRNKLVELGKYLICLYLALKCTDHLQCQGHGDRRTGRQKDRSNAKTPYCIHLILQNYVNKIVVRLQTSLKMSKVVPCVIA